ncbi:hypothetical protein HS961_12115 [Comamonas piscis]|uniref:Uncharacterized protein n=1 Tax=Comamonas piscis TaxID=1562974 RepID=A0A7G5EHN6_9BURK|nr:hypothetical protein [Comamonas piscis]QMV73511.1 hypothetical protein HS961_12115 [Comamonas piscis]WSO31928.1 hypothetical protein VUJ63_12150 [Comamonas piscis]
MTTFHRLKWLLQPLASIGLGVLVAEGIHHWACAARQYLSAIAATACPQSGQVKQKVSAMLCLIKFQDDDTQPVGGLLAQT